MSRPPLKTVSPWMAMAVLWIWLFLHLQVEWTLNPQYNYGWGVPFLALLLFYFRWQRRPPPDLRVRNDLMVRISMAITFVFLLPIRIVEEANPDWRFLSWVLALCVVDVSLLTLYRTGGVNWLKHFAFVVCFPLAAVPWPVAFENFVVQTMMRSVAYVAVEIASWFGLGAYQLGNVIQLRNGFVGVDEACSGVKTLQAGIMVALVLGELLRLPWARRGALVLLGCAWVFLCNVFRATALVFVAANSGLDALARWHDAIGVAALLAGMAGMFVLAWFWKRELAQGASASPSSTRPARVFPTQWGALAWVVLVFVGTEIWYRSHERQLIERSPWQVAWPASNDTVTPLPIPDSTRVILRYDEAKTAAWEQPGGVRWWTFFAHWKPERAALQLVRSHSPEICLPAIGRHFRSTRDDVNVEAGPLALTFRSYEFEQDGRPLFVFVCIQEDKRLASNPAAGAWNLGGRLGAAWEGKRNLGQRLLEIAVVGLGDFSEATEALAKTVHEIVRVEKITG